jgi:hypothetical protein
MKTLTVTIFALFTFAAANGQEKKVEVITQPVKIVEEAPKVARLYRRAGSRVKSALEFRTKSSFAVA